MTDSASNARVTSRSGRPGRLVDPQSWHPIDVEDLESAAWNALRAEGCSAVTAGPGAGKTEFLAQRAAYLLQTGLCPAPQRILAISFKRDAAANLGRRVRTRLPDHAARFVSMTFDAFTKNLVDRFYATLPTEWALHGKYELSFPSPTEQRDFLDNLSATADPALRDELFALPRGNFVSEIVGSYRLPSPIPDAMGNASEVAALAWWKRHYLQANSPSVDFIMLNRLAELLVRRTPHISRALTLTYPYVFIDEFQDTTYAQYSFLRSVFGDGTTVTAVGDRKQRIMGWAGALADAFAEFCSDFDADAYSLTSNFRSSPALVELQHAVATRLDPSVATAVSKAAADIVDEPIHIWTFPNEEREAAVIADWIAADTAGSGRAPADYALVARQKVAGFEKLFRTALSQHGIRLRNDDALIGKARLQDLLKDNIGRFFLGIFRLATAGGQPTIWLEISEQMTKVRGVSSSDEPTSRTAVDELSIFIRDLRRWLHDASPSAATARQATRRILEFVSLDSIRRELTNHQQADETEIFIDAFETRLSTIADSAGSWREALDEYEAADAVPLMTVHRSKGLEYHTVFFLGLDGAQWWSHTRSPEESTATFFVGLSRAAQRTIFTSCVQRGDRSAIADFYSILEAAGVEETHWE
ncbi:UvrD-helicase domain-containing protein [Nocardia gipuzkoensis]